MRRAVIVDAVRTPTGRRGGLLSGWQPADLGAVVLQALVERNDETLRMIATDPDESPRLLGSRCPACTEVFFPRRQVCARCLHDGCDDVELGPTGTLWTWTYVRVPLFAKKDATVSNFNALAREHSIDKATNMRGGNLGFLSPDGTSNEPGLKVEVDVVKAVQKVKDGELVPEPVAEAGNFAVVWRRGTVAPSKRSIEDVTGQIKDTLFRERVDKATQKLLDDLRAKDVKDVNESLLAIVEVSPADGTISATRRPGQVAPTDKPTAPK